MSPRHRLTRTRHFIHCFSIILLSAFSDTPRITLAPRDHKVKEGGIISFFCKASGNPAPEIHWLRNGKRLAGARRFIITDMPHGSVLRIEPVRAGRDDATFTCVAVNGIGEPAKASASLQVYPNDVRK